MTLSLAAVFLPLVFMTGLVGRIFHEFAITIIVAILASGVVSLTLTPLMCARLLGQRGGAEGAKNMDGTDHGFGRASRARRVWKIAVVLPSPSLGFDFDLGHLSGGNGLSRVHRAQGVPSDRRQFVCARRNDRARRRKP